jgi:hypothetical protein
MGVTVEEQLSGPTGGAGTYRLSHSDSITSTTFTVIQTGRPSTFECRYQRTEEEVMLHNRLIIPFVYRPKGNITADISGTTLTVSNANGVNIGVFKGSVTASVNGDLMTVTSANGAAIVAGDWPRQTDILPGTSILSQVSSSEPGGVLNGAGVYHLSQAQPTIASTLFDIMNTAANFGLRHASLPNGIYIKRQITGVAAGAGTYELNHAASIASTSFTVIGAGDIRVNDIPWRAATGGGDGEGATGIDSGYYIPVDALSLNANVPAGQQYVRFVWKGDNLRFLNTIDLDLVSLTLRLQWTVTYRVEELD